MPTTSSLGFPYPGLSDPPHGPDQIQALAEAVEGQFLATPQIGQLVFYAFRTTAQSTTSTTTITAATAISFADAAVQLDLLGGHSGTVENTRYTAPLSGWYEISGYVGFAADNTGNIRGCAWRKNGSGSVDGSQVRDTAATLINAGTGITASTTPVQMNGSTDYIELVALHNATTALDSGVGSFAPFVAVKYVGAL